MCFILAMKNNQISFEARFIKPLPIKKYSYETKSYMNTSSKLIEFDPTDLKDVKDLENIAKDFGGDSFANNIYIHAKYQNEHHPESKVRYLGITQQKEDLNNLDVSKILGVAEITNKMPNEAELDFLQVHPQYLKSYWPPSIKHTGTAIINYLKECYNKISLKSSANATFFYKKNGFTLVDRQKRLFEWKRPD